jgi:acetyltransferase-like isoleucine patch superfamily enzyme
LITWRPQAQIVLGNNVGLNGTVINAYESIEIDDLCNLADAYIIDSSAHHLSADRRFLPVETVPRAPVHLERNVWVSLGVVILKGVTIGANSVVGACALVRRDVPPNTFVAGNPARELGSVPERFDDAPSPADGEEV